MILGVLLEEARGPSNNYRWCNRSLQWYEASTTTYHFIIDDHSVAGNGLEEVIEGGAYLALSEGDKIVGFEESSSDFHVILSGEEHYQPT